MGKRRDNFGPLRIIRKLLQNCGIIKPIVTSPTTYELVAHTMYNNWKIVFELFLRIESYIVANLKVPAIFLIELLKLATKVGSQQIVKMLFTGLTPDHNLLCHALMLKLEEAVEILLEIGADVNSLNENGYMPIHLAAKLDSLKNVQLLVMFGATVNVKSPRGLLPIHLAILKKRTNIVQFLIEKGSDINSSVKVDSETYSRSTCIHLAVQVCSPDIVALLVHNGVNVDPPILRGRFLMDYAVHFKNTKVVEILLKANTNVNSKNDYDEMPIHVASLLGSLDCVKLLKSYGADINARGAKGWRPIHYAVLNNFKEIVQFLVANGADVNPKNDQGSMPIHLAAQKGCINIMEFLIQHGANVVAKGFNGWLPLHYASYFKQVNVAKVLTDNGGHNYFTNDGGYTPMDFAIMYGGESIFRLFLNNGAIVRQDSIQLAIKNHCVEMIQHLIEYGLDINEKNGPFSDAPFFEVARCGCIRCVAALKECIKFGANTFMKDDQGKTILEYALSKGKLKVYKFLTLIQIPNLI